ncbi:hypothetical protein [Pseudomonas sp. B15(2017)]|uniref:hypothetical protein n=1 Tax=Pseudomonas sp. B15(2017) TaxID=1981744 RepID=UPI000A1F769D|nr:hypothetical protein [Pseudomonas sp. B15(2017)]
MNRLRTYWVDQANFWLSRSLEWWAPYLTALYIGGAVIIMGAKFDDLIALKLNEIGDLAAGVFGPLAFLWLILGYLQQGKELKASTDALKLQAKELNNSVAQQKMMVASQERSLINYENSIEPLLKALVVYAGWDEDGFYCTVSIENFGEYCELINVYSHAKSGASSLDNLDPLFTGDLVTYRFYGLKEFEEFEVIVEYTARSGIKNAQSFDMKTYRDDDESKHRYFVKKIPFLSSSFYRNPTL